SASLNALDGGWAAESNGAGGSGEPGAGVESGRHGNGGQSRCPRRDRGSSANAEDCVSSATIRARAELRVMSLPAILALNRSTILAAHQRRTVWLPRVGVGQIRHITVTTQTIGLPRISVPGL